MARSWGCRIGIGIAIAVGGTLLLTLPLAYAIVWFECRDGCYFEGSSGMGGVILGFLAALLASFAAGIGYVIRDTIRRRNARSNS